MYIGVPGKFLAKTSSVFRCRSLAHGDFVRSFVRLNNNSGEGMESRNYLLNWLGRQLLLLFRRIIFVLLSYNFSSRRETWKGAVEREIRLGLDLRYQAYSIPSPIDPLDE